MKIKWTVELDKKMLELSKTNLPSEICRALSISRYSINRRARKLGLTFLRRMDRLTVPPDLWISIAADEARKAEVKPTHVLSHRTHRKLAEVRWKAAKRILDENPHFSIAGVARASGWDHTTLLHGLKRLEGWTPKQINAGIGTASGRRPLPRQWLVEKAVDNSMASIL